MANRWIGIDITPGSLRLAVLGEHRGAVTVIALEQRVCGDTSELPALLGELVPGGFQLADRAAAALPAGEGYARTLQFPFRERKKVLAAVPFALAAQLPIPLDDCLVSALTPEPVDGGSRTAATAIPRSRIEAILAVFDENRIPLHILDVMPYALAGGLGDRLDTAVLACLTEREATLSRLVGGKLVDFRHVPLDGRPPDRGTAATILREAALLLGSTPDAGPLLITGALATEDLIAQAQAAGLPAESLTLDTGHRQIPPAFVPAVALALRAGKKVEDRAFNLRKGSYAYRGEAAVLRRLLFGLGGMLGAAILIFAAATFLDYREKNRQAEALLQQMTRQYRETFPGSPLTVDVALQMESKLQELRNRAASLGIGGQPQVLAILRELSTVAARTPYAVEELACDQEACTLIGSTDSFEAVNRLKEQFGASARFRRVEVAETRRGSDGGSVEFRMRLTLPPQGEQP